MVLVVVEVLAIIFLRQDAAKAAEVRATGFEAAWIASVHVNISPFL